jgi:hypothetical protein
LRFFKPRKEQKLAKEFSAGAIYDKDNFKIVQMKYAGTPVVICFGTPLESDKQIVVSAKTSAQTPEAEFKYGSGKKYKWTIIDTPTIIEKFIPPKEKGEFLASSCAYASGTISTSEATAFISLSADNRLEVNTPSGEYDLIATDQGLKASRPRRAHHRYQYTE